MKDYTYTGGSSTSITIDCDAFYAIDITINGPGTICNLYTYNGSRYLSLYYYLRDSFTIGTIVYGETFRLLYT